MSDMKNTLSGVADGIRIAMVMVDGSNGPEARPMTVQRIDGDEVWFLVGDHASWLTDIDGPANLTFVDDKTWVSATGALATVRDTDVLDDLEDPVSDAWFQEGDHAVALRFTIDHGEWWTSPGFVRTALSVVKAKASGEQPNAGEHGQL